MFRSYIFKNFSLYLIFIIASLFFVEAYAIEAPTNIRISTVESDAIVIDWKGVPEAIGYYHYIGEASKEYTVGIDLITETEYRVEDVDTSKTYYMSVTAVDEFGVESEFSSELVYAPGIVSDSNTDSFRLLNVQVVDATSLELSFSRDLNTSVGANREFILEQKSNGIEIPVTFSEVNNSDNSKLILLLQEDLRNNTEYELTALEVSDAQGNTISAGIDAFISFTSPSEPQAEEDDENDLNASGDETEETNNDNITQENDVSTDEDSTNDGVEVSDTNSANINEGNAGTTINTPEMDNSTNAAAANTDKLPTTGPEHWLLLLVAVAVSGAWYYKKK